ncbi:MAG TPA: hypothetical protein VM223_27980 [Planctomycetota bacterium]|nr:hypothetical protein [Planctomycetota bacterium]
MEKLKCRVEHGPHGKAEAIRVFGPRRKLLASLYVTPKGELHPDSWMRSRSCRVKQIVPPRMRCLAGDV